MPTLRQTLCLLLPLVFGAGALGLTAAEFRLPPETARFNPGPGAELAGAHCLLCHSADYISTQPRLTRASWKAAVEKMRQKYGAPIAPDQIDPLLDYLVKNYGREETVTRPPGSK
jgi:mono/diheme cytochrome c family protein